MSERCGRPDGRLDGEGDVQTAQERLDVRVCRAGCHAHHLLHAVVTVCTLSIQMYWRNEEEGAKIDWKRSRIL